MSWIAQAGPYLVGVAGIVGGVATAGISQRGARRLTDLDHLRAVLDDAAVALHKADQALGTARLEQIQRGPSAFQPLEDGTRSAALDEMQEVGLQLDVLNQRLAIRLGPDDDTAHAFSLAANHLLAGYEAAQREALSLSPPTDDPAMRGQLRTYQDKGEAEVDAARTGLNQQRQEFLRGAVRAAGTKLS